MFHIHRNLLNDVSKLVDFLDLPRDLATAGAQELILLWLLRVRGQLGVDGRRGLDGRVRGRVLVHAERATQDAVHASEEAVQTVEFITASGLVKQ